MNLERFEIDCEHLGLDYIGKMEKLRVLKLNAMGGDDMIFDWNNLKGLVALEELVLIGGIIGGDEVIFPKLKKLELVRCRLLGGIGRIGEILGRMCGLRELVLDGYDLTRNDLDKLMDGRLGNLRFVGLNCDLDLDLSGFVRLDSLRGQLMEELKEEGIWDNLIIVRKGFEFVKGDCLRSFLGDDI